MSENNGIRPSPPGRTPKRELRKIPAATLPVGPMLDLVHVTAVGHAREILDAQQIETRTCPVFGRDLVYAFVGRPAYRPRDGGNKSDQINRFPFVFIISPDKLPPPHHVYPFDTGAGHAGRYGDAADPYVFREDYELASDLEAARRHIAWAFGSNERYFRGDVRPEAEFDLAPYDSVVRGCLTIARLASSGSNRPDSRASAIEVAFSQHIRLRDHVKLTVMPLQFIEHGAQRNAPVRDALKQLGIAYRTYNWQPHSTPDDHMDEITRIVEGFLFASGTP